MFGIDALKKHLDRRLDDLERKLNHMPTREEFNAAKQQLKDAIAAETKQVSDAIQELRDKLNSGATITDDDLAELQTDVIGVGNVLPDTPPTA